MAERRKAQGMEVCDKFKGFHDSLASREGNSKASTILRHQGKLLLPMGWQHSRIPFCGVELRQIWNRYSLVFKTVLATIIYLFCDSKSIWGGKLF
jgi:hypothetical protein